MLCQVVAGVLPLIPATATLGAVLYLPVGLSVVLITCGMGFEGTVRVTGGMLLSVVFLICRDGDRVGEAAAGLLGERRERPTLLAGANRIEKTGWVPGGAVGIAMFLTTRNVVPGHLLPELFWTGIGAVGSVVAGRVIAWRRR